MEINGFNSYSLFKKRVKDIKQLYDITLHLYTNERQRLKTEFVKIPRNITINTSIGEIGHSPLTLYQRLEDLYPYKLKELLLISAITSLEVYLTSVIEEVIERDKNVMKQDNNNLSYSRNYLFHLSSIKKMQKDIVRSDIRQLTSGGLNQIKKYYKNYFKIQFEMFPGSYYKLEFAHRIRHIFVHRGGIVDDQFLKTYKDEKICKGNRCVLSHVHFSDLINIVSAFGSYINKELLKKYPVKPIDREYYKSEGQIDIEIPFFLCELSGLQNGKKDIDYINSIEHLDTQLKQYIVQCVLEQNNCILILNIEKEKLTKFYGSLRGSYVIERLIELKGFMGKENTADENL